MTETVKEQAPAAEPVDFDALIEEAAGAEGLEGERRVRPTSGSYEGESIDVPGPAGAAETPLEPTPEQTKALAAGLDTAIRMLVGAPQREGELVDFASDEGQLTLAADFLEPFSRTYLGQVVGSPIGGLVAAVVFLLAFALKDAAAAKGEEEPEGDILGDLGIERAGAAEPEGEGPQPAEPPRARRGPSPKAEIPRIGAPPREPSPGGQET